MFESFIVEPEDVSPGRFANTIAVRRLTPSGSPGSELFPNGSPMALCSSARQSPRFTKENLR